MSTRVLIFIHTHVYIYRHMYTQIHLHTYVHIYTYKYICKYIVVCERDKYSIACVYIKGGKKELFSLHVILNLINQMDRVS